MATNSSNVAWKIPWTEEPGRLEPMGVTKSQTRLSDLLSYIASLYIFKMPFAFFPLFLS